MKRISISQGVYLDSDTGLYWARPEIDGRRTWRRLKAVTKKAAIEETHRTTWAPKLERFAELAQSYLDAGCPTARLEPRSPAAQGIERRNLGHLTAYFGKRDCDAIKLRDLTPYKTWRIERLTRSTSGSRIVDMELVTLSNVFSYAVAMGIMDTNDVRNGRPRFHRESDVRHCRDVAPVDGDELNRLAGVLFDNPRSVPLGWQLLLEAMTGCRTNEILALRMDAAGPDTPGWVQNNWLFLKRSKKGVNPYAMIHPDLREVLDAHRRWHAEYAPLSPWYIPGRDRVSAMSPTSLSHALQDAAKALGLPHRTSHGLRSFYVTKRRSDGVSDAQIAGEIGDKTVELIHRTYGDRPANWLGGAQLSWRPSKGEPAWTQIGLSPVQAESNLLTSECTELPTDWVVATG